MLPGRAKICASGTSWIHFSAAVRSSDLLPFSFFLSPSFRPLWPVLHPAFRDGSAFSAPGFTALLRQAGGIPLPVHDGYPCRPAGSLCRYTPAPPSGRIILSVHASTPSRISLWVSECAQKMSGNAGLPLGLWWHLLQPWAGCTIFSHIELVSNFNKEHSL